ncbi:hypothetical protein D9M68_571820 [compost metagenome]
MTWTCSNASSSATCTISSSVSHTMTSPQSAQLCLAMAAVGSIVSWRSTSASVSLASFSLLVSSTAGEVGPCSAWPSKSTAHNSPSTLSSAMTSVSVGPANRSIPTRPYSWRLASATNILPGPTSMSTGATLGVPTAMATTACTPPSTRISSAPAMSMAVTMAGCGLP